MRITDELGKNLLEKIEKVLGRKAYIFNESGALLDKGSVRVDMKALEAVQRDSVITEKKDGRYSSWAPIEYAEKVIGAVCVTDELRDKSQEFSNLAKGMAEVLLYEEFLVKNVFIANDLRSEFVKEVLMGSKIRTTEEAIDQGDIVGVNLRFRHAVMVLRIKDLYEDYVSDNSKLPYEVIRTKFQAYLSEIEDMLTEACKEDIHDCIVYIGEGRFVMLKDISKEDINTANSFKLLKSSGQHIFNVLNSKFSGRVSIGVGQFYPGLSGLRKSFEDANIALKLGEKVVGSGNVYHILDVAMFVGLLTNVESTRKNELAFQVLYKLLQDDDLLKTVRVFLENGMNLTEAAKKLHLHRNTLIYRLGKVKSLIGLDPSKFNDALQLKLGLMMYTSQETLLGVN